MSQISEETKMIIASNLVVASQLRMLYWAQRKSEPGTTKSEDEIILAEFKKFHRLLDK
jgi:hypothetical protein